MSTIGRNLHLRTAAIIGALLVIIYSGYQLSTSNSQLATKVVGQPKAETLAAPTGLKPANFNILASADAFSPNLLKIKLGQTVRLRIFSHGDHRFVIDELGIRIKTPDNKTTEIEFTPNQAGTFRFYCDETKHRLARMEGRLIVK